MDFLVDAMLPLKLSDFLNKAGHNSIHTSNLPSGNSTKDSEINQFSISQKRVVISKDTDFVNSIRISNLPFKLLLVKSGNLSNNELLELFSSHINKLEIELSKSTFVEISPLGIISHF